MSFLVLPPEINSAAMYSGAGSAPMLEAAAAWDGLASELGSAASSFSSVISGLVGQAWQGPASAAMTAAAAPYTGWLSAASAHASGAVGQARAVVSAFESAFASTVHPMAVAANRNSFVQAVRSNWFGLNAPAFAEFEAYYETMWARDVAAMVGYHAGASAAAQQMITTPEIDEAILSTPFNFGFPNIGFFNVGAFNVGDFNVGLGNFGLGNVGIGNVGTGNFGEFLTGDGKIGIGPMSTTSM
jgi:PPE-repeat protein